MCKKDVEKMEALKPLKHIALLIIVSINQQQYGEWANVSFLIFKLVVY